MFKSGVTIWYSVTSVETTLAFYTEKLGFTSEFHDVSSGMAVVQTNVKDCYIGLSESEAVVPSTSATVFEVANVEEAVQLLKQKGVSFVGGIETVPGVVKFATFSDPDGHSLELSESIA